MSIKIMTLVWATELGGPTIKAVAMKLADCAHDDGTTIHPSVKHIARHTEISERAAQYAIKKLRSDEMGVLRLIEAGGGVKASLYAFDLPVLERLHTETQKRWRKQDAKTGAKSAPVQKTSERGAPRAPYPLKEPSLDQRFANLNGKGSKSQPAESYRFVSEAALDRVRAIAPGWDRQFLLRAFLAWDGSKTARNMDAAFVGWVPKFTKGKRP